MWVTTSSLSVKHPNPEAGSDPSDRECSHYIFRKLDSKQDGTERPRVTVEHRSADQKDHIVAIWLELGTKIKWLVLQRMVVDVGYPVYDLFIDIGMTKMTSKIEGCIVQSAILKSESVSGNFVVVLGLLFLPGSVFSYVLPVLFCSFCFILFDVNFTSCLVLVFLPLWLPWLVLPASLCIYTLSQSLFVARLSLLLSCMSSLVLHVSLPIVSNQFFVFT